MAEAWHSPCSAVAGFDEMLRRLDATASIRRTATTATENMDALGGQEPSRSRMNSVSTIGSPIGEEMAMTVVVGRHKHESRAIGDPYC